jgi:hypothetical protein
MQKYHTQTEVMQILPVSASCNEGMKKHYTHSEVMQMPAVSAGCNEGIQKHHTLAEVMQITPVCQQAAMKECKNITHILR